MDAATVAALSMRVAVISDIHANLHALEAVLGAIDGKRPDALWCLGDLVGYGPRPNECAALVRERAQLCLVGNHDLVALGTAEVAIEEFNPDAAAAALWTQQVLDAETRSFLSSLEPHGSADGAELYHASPRDPVWEYVLSDDAIIAAFEETSSHVILVGHSHVALAFELNGSTIEGGLAAEGTEGALAHGRWLLNPGSVGQPRDSDPRAAYLLLDFGAGAARFHRVDYPITRTQEEIREHGLPESLAVRLAHGQ